MEPVGRHALSRRRALALLGSAATAVAATSCASHTSDAQPSGATPPDAYELSGDVDGYATTLILLGTAAGPIAVPGRSGTSSVLVVGDRPYLIDAGPWSSRKLIQAGIAADSLGGVFVTHMHSDHIADLFNVFWLPGGTPSYTFRNVVPVYGPGSAGRLSAPRGGQSIPIQSPASPAPGLTDLFAGVLDAFAYDINIRNVEKGAQSDYGQRLSLHDVLPPESAGASPDNTAPDMEPFPVFEDDRIRVTATLVPHGPVYPSLAYRFDTEDGAVTFSGDTAKSPNVVRLAQGSDILVHEVIDVDFYAQTSGPALVEHMIHAHTTAQDVGRVATDADVRQVVLSHIGPGDPRQVTDDQWERGVKSTFAGTVTVGHDLVRIGVGQRR
ncbi:MBL fold metallo-hydrolase [Rhodococcus sp. ACPA1]|uniref:MBL fold metallo-hydrolase n=1 Tax=Rhodococcus sp. ACPA1 TaxID=2028572 RepID=UPI000BB0D3A1|nr:MBL fold metallo-hydrolase [Rhodococcus sp. ACPA1]PBC55273.1 MBL fold metallo-hydrolase [Rhodococcus sp. ACPA1]